MKEIVFEVTRDVEGGYVAECLTDPVFTQADSWDELRSNAREAVAAYFHGRDDPPDRIRLHLGTRY